jgi:hypothetical protein
LKGAFRKGVNIFTKLKESQGHDSVGVGHSTHIIHNIIQTIIVVLPVDTKNLFIFLHVQSELKTLENIKRCYAKVKPDGLPSS